MFKKRLKMGFARRGKTRDASDKTVGTWKFEQGTGYEIASVLSLVC